MMAIVRRTIESSLQARNRNPATRPATTAGASRSSVGQCAWRRYAMSANTSPTMNSSSVAAVEGRAGRTAAIITTERVALPGIAVLPSPATSAARPSSAHAQGARSITPESYAPRRSRLGARPFLPTRSPHGQRQDSIRMTVGVRSHDDASRLGRSDHCESPTVEEVVPGIDVRSRRHGCGAAEALQTPGSGHLDPDFVLHIGGANAVLVEHLDR